MQVAQSANMMIATNGFSRFTGEDYLSFTEVSILMHPRWEHAFCAKKIVTREGVTDSVE